MKRLSDYEGAEALDLWVDIFDDVSTIISDDEVRGYTTGQNISINKAAKLFMKKYPKETLSILKRIDGNINGASAFPAVVNLVFELTLGDKASAFFSPAGQENSEEEPSGSATENTEGGLN